MTLRAPKHQSLTLRLPLLISALVAAVVAALLGASYYEVRSTLTTAGGDRAYRAAEQLAGLFSQAAAARVTGMRPVASDPALLAFVAEPAASVPAEVDARLASLQTGAQQAITVEVWDARGTLLVARQLAPEREAKLAPRQAPSAEGVGPYAAEGGEIFYDTVVRIAAADAVVGAPALGYLVVRTFVAQSAAVAGLLNNLVGDGASVKVGSPQSGVWTDLSAMVSGPPVAWAAGDSGEYVSADGDDRVGGLAAVADLPWAVLVEFPSDLVTAPVGAFLARMLTLALLFVVGAVVLTRVFSARITRPLAEVMTAAEAVAAGDYAARVTPTRRDEVGRLGHAFNTMGEQIEAAHRRLESRAQELAQSREELYRQKAILESVVQAMRDGVAVADREGRFVLFNEAAEQTNGLGATETPPEGWADAYRLFHPDGTTPLAADDVPLTRALRGESTDDVELIIRNPQAPDGVLVRCYGRPLRDESGAVTGGMVITEDITDRRRAEQALHESEARKAAVVNGALDCIVTTDRDGLISDFNPAAEAMLGYTRAEVVGRSLVDLAIAGAHRPLARATLQKDVVSRAATSGGGARIDLRAVRRDGTEFPAEVSLAGIERDGPAMFCWFIRDLTAHKAAEEARLRSAQLEQENRRVQEASRLKSEFLANMSHELRTPLNAIIGFAELLHDGQVPPDAPQFKEFLQDILRSGEHLLQLINDILDLSKVEAGRLEFHPTDLDTEEALAEVVGILRPLAAQKRLEVRQVVEPDARHVVLDRGRFKQVLYNYLSNAIKFTPEGGRLTATVKADGADAICIEVEDTGIGIAETDLGRLFREFTQLEGGASKRHQGTGLGLALTRRLVEAQGGRVGVRSTVGKGSVFSAHLPKIMENGTPLAPPRSIPGARVGASTVLVVEDQPRDQDALVQALVGAGYAVETATTAAQAGEKLRRQRFDAITLDLILPDKSGLDVLKEIRADERNRDVPVIVVTLVARDGLTTGFAVQDVLAKPVEPDQLVMTLRRIGVRPGAAGGVLVVDDDQGSLRLMAAALQQLGHESTCVDSGQAALTAAEQSPPAAVVLDLMMPEMDGFQFLEAFRQLAGCDRVPVLVWTAKDLSRDDLRRLRAAAQGIMGKGQHGTASVIDQLRRFVAPVVSA